MRRLLLVLVLVLVARGGRPAHAQTELVNANMVVLGHVNTCATDPSGTTGNTYVCALTVPLTQLQAKTCYTFRADAANTGAAFLNLGGTGAVSLVKMQGGTALPLAAGDIRAGMLVTACYDGTNLQCQTCWGNGLSSACAPRRVLPLACIPEGTALTTGTGKCFLPVTADLAGSAVVSVSAGLGAVATAGGAAAVMLTLDVCSATATGAKCSGSTRALLTTALSIDQNEATSSTAATPPVLDLSTSTLALDEWVRVNITATSTGAAGLYLTLALQP